MLQVVTESVFKMCFNELFRIEVASRWQDTRPWLRPQKANIYGAFFSLDVTKRILMGEEW